MLRPARRYFSCATLRPRPAQPCQRIEAAARSTSVRPDRATPRRILNSPSRTMLECPTMKIDRRGFLVASSAALALAKSQLSAANDAQAAEPSGMLEIEQAIQGKEVGVYTTADKSNHRLSRTDTLIFKHLGQPLETQICVFVDPTRTFQTILGIGGALTDASAETFAKLSPAKQQEILTAYFDVNTGIGYTLARTNIHSCDFSSGSYTYVDEGDKELRSFSVKHDEQYRIPFIKKVQAATKGKLTVFGSPWSPPAFMKDNHDMLHGGKLKPEFYQSWANYYTRFIKV